MYNKKSLLGLLIIFFTLILVSCDKPECTPGQSSRTEGCDQFKRVNSTVRKGSASAPSLPVFTQSGWHPLNSGEAVSTNSSGMAELNFSGCWPGQLFCFKDSGLTFQVATCDQVTFENTPLACVPNGSIYTNGPCPAEYAINTGSARINKTGTVLSITYLPDKRNVTLVIVLEGSVTVEPVLDVNTAELGRPDNVDTGFFYFTMPDNQLSPIGDLQPRQAYPIPELPPVVAELDIWDWMFNVRERAEVDGIPPENWPPELGGPGDESEPPQPENEVFVNSAGGAFDDPRVQEALLHAVDWPEAAAAVNLEDTRLTGFVGPDAIDLLRDIVHDPDLSWALLAEAGYPNGLGATLFYPPDDPQLARMGKMIVPIIAKAGFDAGLQELNDESEELLARLEEAGEAFIILNR